MGFYSKLFGSGSTDSTGRTVFRFGKQAVTIVAHSGPGPSSLDRFSVEVKDFSSEQAHRILRDRGIEPHDNGVVAEVHFRDPDGIQVQLVD